MGRLEREATDARNVEANRRMSKCLFGQLPQQVFIVHAIKKPLLENVQILTNPQSNSAEKLRALLQLRKVLKAFDKLPEPTKENTWHPNSHRMIEVRDWFFERCKLSEDRLNFVRTGFNFIIMLYDYDPPYRDMIDDTYAELKKKGWTPGESLNLIEHDWAFWKLDKEDL